HPELPWTGTRLRMAEFDRRGRPLPARHIAGGRQESIVQPLFSPDGTLHFCSDRSGWWNLHAWKDGAVRPVAPVAAEIGGPDRMLATRHYNFLDDGRILCRMVDEGIMHAALIDQDQ